MRSRIVKGLAVSLVLMMVIVFVGCARGGARVVRPSTVKLDTVKRIALVEVRFRERDLPIFPLIEAGVYNSQVEGVKDQLARIEKSTSEKMTSFYKEEIVKFTQKEVVVVSNSLPNFVFAEIETTNFVSESIKKIAEENNCDLVVYIPVWVDTYSVQNFGFVATHELKGQMIVFNNTGRVRATAEFNSDPSHFGPTDTKKYQQLVNMYHVFGEEMVMLAFTKGTEQTE